MAIRYARVSWKGQRPLWLEVTREDDALVIGYEVNRGGERIDGHGFDERMRVIGKSVDGLKVRPATMNLRYAELEVAS